MSERRSFPSVNSDLELLRNLPRGEAIFAGENEVNLRKKAITRKRDAVNNIRIPCCTYIYCSLITFAVTTVVTHLYFILLFIYFWPRLAACGILVPRPGIERGPTAVKAPRPNHWTAKEFPATFILKMKKLGTERFSNCPRSHSY